MEVYHVTMSQGRSDGLTLEASGKTDILNLLNSMSTAVVSSIN
jgi:hypothetical protein